ncbi:MAG: MBL fold metallo-hydrolase [Syntrophales bacterium]|nr:MBL fold metallo-hydrolase [Syntrophales bacterium]
MGYGEEIFKGVYIVGGPGISHADDAACYVVESDGDLIMIDCGAGGRTSLIVRNIEGLGLDPHKLKWIVLTHCHIDHVGGAGELRERFGASIAIHALDAPPIEQGDASKTAAAWYGRRFLPLEVDWKFTGSEEKLSWGKDVLYILHTPGHTPGSIVCYLDREEKRICFGQDIHGPFLSSFGSDVKAWRESMHRLLSLNIDILCEGHFGIFQPRERAEGYIRKYLALNADS